MLLHTLVVLDFHSDSVVLCLLPFRKPLDALLVLMKLVHELASIRAAALYLA
jgi:hypothetical protein